MEMKPECRAACGNTAAAEKGTAVPPVYRDQDSEKTEAKNCCTDNSMKNERKNNYEEQ